MEGWRWDGCSIPATGYGCSGYYFWTLRYRSGAR